MQGLSSWTGVGSRGDEQQCVHERMYDSVVCRVALHGGAYRHFLYDKSHHGLRLSVDSLMGIKPATTTPSLTAGSSHRPRA